MEHHGITTSKHGAMEPAHEEANLQVLFWGTPPLMNT
jgi:hypothetical protein